MAVRCLIVDDDDGFLNVARDLLDREQINVVGVATNSARAIRLMTSARPDVMLIDVNLGEDSGFDLVDSITGIDAQPILILISTYTLDDSTSTFRWPARRRSSQVRPVGYGDPPDPPRRRSGSRLNPRPRSQQAVR